jgi:hypothetical protein
MPLRQACKGGMAWVQSRNKELRRQVDHLGKQALQVPEIELRRRIIHK